MMGELAEQWTAGSLRELQQSGWRVVNHFGLGVGDIDHVVVGSPGVFLVETKWSASAWTQDWAKEEVEAAVRQVANNARLMAMWENYKRLGLPGPTPLVALWGSGAGDLAGALRRPDVLAGGDIAGYLRGQELVDPRLDAEQIESVLRVVHGHVQKRDAAEADRNPIPESIQALAFRFASGVVAGLVSFVGAGYLLKAGLPLWAWFTALGAMIGIEHLLRRRPSLRNVVTGSQAALVMTALLVAAVAGAQIVR